MIPVCSTVVCWFQEIENKKALKAQQRQEPESTENVQQESSVENIPRHPSCQSVEQQSDVEKTKCEDDQNEKSQIRGL